MNKRISETFDLVHVSLNKKKNQMILGQYCLINELERDSKLVSTIQ